MNAEQSAAPADGLLNRIAELERKNRRLAGKVRSLQTKVDKFTEECPRQAAGDPLSMCLAELQPEKYLRLLLENSPDSILVLDGEGCLVDCSTAFLKLIKVGSRDSIRGRSFREIYGLFENDSYVEQAVQRFESVKADRKTVVANVSIRFPGKGKRRLYTIQVAPMLDEEGNVDGVLAMYHDSTDLGRAEADVRTRIMLDATPLACSFWSKNGNPSDCNRAALLLFGLSSKAEYLANFHYLSPELQPDGSRSRDRIREDLRRTFKSGHETFEWTHRTVMGDLFPAEITLVRVKWREGFRVVSYARDLRQIKAGEQKIRMAEQHSRELEVQSRAARVASESKSSFLASMSHEIRTPMNAILGMSDLIRTDNFDNLQIDFFNDIKKMSKALLHIINDILDFSKIEAGKLEIVPTHFNLLELYDNVCSMSRFMADSKELSFTHSFDMEVPHVIYGDDVRIRQVITNILNNAIKYTREGHVDFRVTCARKNARQYVAFVVTDTGIGIKKEDLPQLFDAFAQFDSTRNRGLMGTGLGLSITNNLVSMMEGSIEVESDYGKGSTFTVLLPLTPGDPAQVKATELIERVIALNGASVLVVDDNQINLKVALAYLARHGIVADTAMNGVEAVRKVQENAYDLVFMDQMMPEMDGLEATRRIRAMEGEKYARLPIVALSANAVKGVNSLFLEAGMNDFISKPIDAGALNRILAKWLPADKLSKGEDVIRTAVPAPAPDSGAGGIIDRAEGLTNAVGDAALYRQLLLDFARKHGDDLKKIQDALEQGDTPTAYRLAHTLKSVAGVIGARALKDSAALVEKNLDDGSGCRSALLEALEADFNAVQAELFPEGFASDPTAPADGALDRARALGLLDRLVPLLNAGNAGCLELIPEARQVFAPFGEKCAELIRQMEDFEFDLAAATAASLTVSAKGQF